ncbi:unnamed protein product, partial [Polarella glacialis]
MQAYLRPQPNGMPVQGYPTMMINPDSSRRMMGSHQPQQVMMHSRQTMSPQMSPQVPAGVSTAGSMPRNQMPGSQGVVYSAPPMPASAYGMAYPGPPPMMRASGPGPVPGASRMGVRSWVPGPQAGYPEQPQMQPGQVPGTPQPMATVGSAQPRPLQRPHQQQQQSLMGTLSSVPVGAPPTTYGMAMPAHPGNNLLRTMQHTGSYHPPPLASSQLAASSRRGIQVEIEIVQPTSSKPRYVPPACPKRVLTFVGIECLDPSTVQKIMEEDKDSKVIVVDLRGEDRQAGIIEGTVHIPVMDVMTHLDDLSQQWSEKHLVLFMCMYSAHRAPACANWYRGKSDPKQRVGILEGGFRGWEAEGLPCKKLADESLGKAADKLAMQIGQDFVDKHVAKKGSHVPAPYSSPHSANGTIMTPSRQVPSYVPLAAVQSPVRASLPAVASQAGRAYVPPAAPNRVPTIANVEHLDPRVVQQMLLVDGYGLLVDLRGEDRASGLIEGAVHVPAIDRVPFLTKIPDLVREWANHPMVVFTCQYSAHRAPQCANWYRAACSPQQRVAILAGGFRGWESLNLPVQAAASSAQVAHAADEKAMQLGTEFVQAAQGQAAPPAEGGPPASIAASAAVQVQAAAAATPASPVSRSLAPAMATQESPKQLYVPPHLPHTVATIKDVEHLEPVVVEELMRTAPNGVVLVDLRGDDRAAGLIEGAVHERAIDTEPFTRKVPRLVEKWLGKPLVVFTCQYSAHRAPQCANWYREVAAKGQRVAILKGGFRGWEANGLPVQSLAQGEERKKADEMALQLGNQFVVEG